MCFKYIAVGVKKNAGKANLYLAIVLTDETLYSGKITCPDTPQTQFFVSLSVGGGFGTSAKSRGCFKHSEIASVKLYAGASEKVHVDSIATYLENSNNPPYIKLTYDPNLDKVVDSNSISLTSYDTLRKKYQCITKIKVDGITAHGKNAGCSANDQSCTHTIQLDMVDDTSIQAEIRPNEAGQPFNQILDLEHDFLATCQCVKRSDIVRVMLLAGNDDSWHISSIRTEYYTKESDTFELLTNDPQLNLWLNRENECYDKEDNITLTLVPFIDIPKCGFGLPVCECAKTAETCRFNLEIEEIMTFTSYQKFKKGGTEGLYYRGKTGAIYYIDESGEEKPHPGFTTSICGNRTKNDCSEPQFVDGKTFRLAIGINGMIPGPTIIVHHNQKVVIDVQNKLTSEGISIHWHGMFQRGTPWMDGVGGVTQCHIPPASNYSYIYTANPSGSFWYHSHTGAQRTDGMYGALIVKESDDYYAKVRESLKEGFNIENFLDHPEDHSLTLIDWARESSLDTFVRENAGLGSFTDTPIGDVPLPNSTRYRITMSPEGAGIGPVPFHSGLINGLGRHDNLPYNKTRLKVFTVQEGGKYRFRLIGAQGDYAYRFSIDGHQLTVVGTDGYWLEPVENVDYIIIHTGERYDFILEANKTFSNYWIRAETLEVHIDSNGPPYEPYEHVAEAILQYKKPDEPAPKIESTEYESIKDNSPPKQCTEDIKCLAVNCPFLEYHEDYNITCKNLPELKLLLPTPPEELPESIPCSDDEDCRHFLNFNFNGKSFRASINGRSFVPPPAPPVTQKDTFDEQATMCNATLDCNPGTLDCLCTHMIELPYNKTVQLVLMSYYGFKSVHPIHLHGHAFHVAKIGYPTYDNTTGKIKEFNPDIYCNVDSDCSAENQNKVCHCTKPTWKGNAPNDIKVNNQTVRKDTVIIPAGGYVVINFISDNPGYWFMHCHIEPHQLQGMALIVGEAVEEAEKLIVPKELNKCGNVEFTVEQYEESRQQFSMLARNHFFLSP